jgi:hypothetical protein
VDHRCGRHDWRPEHAGSWLASACPWRDHLCGRAVETDCVTDDCLSRWPPLGGRELPAAGDGVDASLIGSFTGPDGNKQATYNGWPLYTFAEDFVEGDVNGHDFEEFGGEWYLVTPEGGALREPDEH